MNERKIKMELLEALMGEMDDAAVSKLKKEPVVQVKEVEEKEMPLSEAKDMIKEKMMGTESEDSEEACSECGKEPCECEEDDMGSDFMRRLQEIRKAKKESK